jgi:hypothetical protein
VLKTPEILAQTGNLAAYQQAGDFEKRPRPANLKTAIILAQFAKGLGGIPRIGRLVLFYLFAHEKFARAIN